MHFLQLPANILNMADMASASTVSSKKIKGKEAKFQ